MQSGCPIRPAADWWTGGVRLREVLAVQRKALVWALLYCMSLIEGKVPSDRHKAAIPWEQGHAMIWVVFVLSAATIVVIGMQLSHYGDRIAES